jgi:ABC-type multidrug transport system fused ATPase/permease subunit
MFNSSVNNLLFKLIKEKPIYLLNSLILSLSSTILNLVSTILLIPILFVLLNNSEPKFTFDKLRYISYLFGFLSNYSTNYQLAIIIFTVFLTILCKNLLNYISTIRGFKYNKDIACSLKYRALNMLSEVNLDYYQKNKVSSILLKLNREIDKTALAVKSIQNIAIISITIVLLTIILFFISWQLSLVCLISIALITYINNSLINQLKYKKFLISEKNQVSNRQLVEFLSGIRFIKTVGNESNARKEIILAIKDQDRNQLITQAISATIKPITEIAGMITVLLLGISSYYLYSFPLSEVIPIILIYLVVLFRLLPFISQFNSAKLQFTNARSSIEVVANFLQEADRQVLSSGNLTFSNLQRGIKFQAVTFAYPQQAQIVLDKINLWIPQGQTIALVGFIGSRKFAIADLLARFYAPIEGKIFLDDHELENYDSTSLRKAIAVVSQNTFLFNNSLAYNIAYGLSNVTQTDIIAAAQKANIYEFISQLPAGLATQVGEGGIMLTEVQKQQIAIARAFLRNPQILVLDEPVKLEDYYSVDATSILKAIDTLRSDRTTLIITQQLQLAKKADQIAVFSRSKIVETGTHEKLLQQGGIYQRLYAMQFKSNQQSRQLKLAQKIARKLAQQPNSSLDLEISSSLNTLLNHLELITESLFDDEQEQNKILDESYQSAKNLLASLREYERKIFREIDQKDNQDT